MSNKGLIEWVREVEPLADIVVTLPPVLFSVTEGMGTTVMQALWYTEDMLRSLQRNRTNPSYSYNVMCQGQDSEGSD